MKKVKILHITQATIGGTLEYIKLFFNHIDKNKYEVCLICPSYGPMKEEIEAMGIKVYPIEMNREISFKSDLNSFLELKRAIKHIKPDIVHLHSSKAGVLGKIASYLNKVPCVYNAHGWSFSMDTSKKKKKIYALIEKYTSKFCNIIVNISDYEHQLAKRYKIANDNKMVTIHNGIDLEKYNISYSKKDILTELNIPEDSFIVGMVARIAEQKDPIKFIEIAKDICSNINNAYFVLVGDGELRSNVEYKIKEYNLENNVKIIGWVNEVEKYISIFDIAILTSKWEGFGLVLAEYMALNKPIVSSNVGAIPELVRHNYNGELVDISENSQGFVQAIMKLYENKNIRIKYVNNGANLVKSKFCINRVIKEHDKLYMNLINK